jgi:hypothetical protein
MCFDLCIFTFWTCLVLKQIRGTLHKIFKSTNRKWYKIRQMFRSLKDKTDKNYQMFWSLKNKTDTDLIGYTDGL